MRRTRGCTMATEVENSGNIKGALFRPGRRDFSTTEVLIYMAKLRAWG